MLSDFSTTGDETRRDMNVTKDFGCDISNFFQTGDGLRDDLDAIDFAEDLQMLDQFNNDPNTQSFKLDTL